MGVRGQKERTWCPGLGYPGRHESKWPGGREPVRRDAKLKPSRIAEWHNMCADRAHAGITKWVGSDPQPKLLRINREQLVISALAR